MLIKTHGHMSVTDKDTRHVHSVCDLQEVRSEPIMLLELPIML